MQASPPLTPVTSAQESCALPFNHWSTSHFTLAMCTVWTWIQSTLAPLYFYLLLLTSSSLSGRGQLVSISITPQTGPCNCNLVQHCYKHSMLSPPGFQIWGEWRVYQHSAIGNKSISFYNFDHH